MQFIRIAIQGNDAINVIIIPIKKCDSFKGNFTNITRIISNLSAKQFQPRAYSQSHRTIEIKYQTSINVRNDQQID